MTGKNRRHASAFAVRFIRPLARQRTSGGCHRERSAANATRSLSTKTEAPVADDLGPGILDHLRSVVRLAACFMFRQTLSSVDSASGFADSGPGCPSRSVGVEVAPEPPPNSADCSSKWPPPIRCGPHPGFMVNSRCSVSPSPNAPCRASCAGSGGHLTRRGRTFLHNHVGQMVSIDFFSVPTITIKVLFVFILLEHARCKVLYFNVTEHPTEAWTAQPRGVRRPRGGPLSHPRSRQQVRC